MPKLQKGLFGGLQRHKVIFPEERIMRILLAVLSLTAGSTFAADSPIIAPGAKLEKLAEGYSFTEGPAADGDGNVFFTDYPNNRIVEWSAADGKFSDWLKPAGRANG
ncbi:MAG: hypothetical protein E5V17_00995, partial [Mesorhizobium sp.]